MRIKLAGLVVALVACLLLSGIARAALQEKPVLDGINNTIAVLRYLHKQVAESQANLELVDAARELTEQQLGAQHQLHKNALDAGDKEAAEFYENRLTRLQLQVENLNKLDFAKIYADKIDAAQAQIKNYTGILNARMKEYEALFGKKPEVEVRFDDIYERYAKKRAGAAFYLDLD